MICSNKPNPAAINGKMNGVDGQVSGRACESCYGTHCFLRKITLEDKDNKQEHYYYESYLSCYMTYQ